VRIGEPIYVCYFFGIILDMLGDRNFSLVSLLVEFAFTFNGLVVLLALVLF